MTMQHDPGALDDQMDVAPSPNELFELPKQIAMKVKTTGAGSAWHTLSIDLALRLFPKPGSNFGPSVLERLRLDAEPVVDGLDTAGSPDGSQDGQPFFGGLGDAFYRHASSVDPDDDVRRLAHRAPVSA